MSDEIAVDAWQAGRVITDDERQAIGWRVEQARLDHGWTKEEACRGAGVTAATWTRIEAGLPVRDASLGRVVGYVNRKTGEPVQAVRDLSDEQLINELARRLALANQPTQVVEDFTDPDVQTVVVRAVKTDQDAPNGR